VSRLALVLGLLVSALVLGQALPRIGDHFLGIEYVDHYGTQWFYWYLSDAVRHGRSLTHTALFFHPYGKDIFGHTGSNLLDAFLALPFLWGFGPVLGYNLFVLAGFVGTAWAFARLARDFVDDRLAIGIAVLIGTFSPYALFEAVEGRPTQALLGLGALFVRSLWRLGDRPRIWDALQAGLWLGLLGYQYWFYAVFFGLAAVVHGLWRLFDGGGLPSLGRHLVAALTALTLVGPVAFPMVADSVDHGGVPGLLDVDAWTWATTPPVTVEGITVGLFEWHPLHGGTGFQVQNPDGTEVFLDHARWGPLGLVAILFLYLRYPGRLRRGPVLAVIALCTVLAAGPIVLVGQTALPNPVFVELLRAARFMRRLWWPARAYAVIVVLGVPMLAVALAEVRARLGAGRQQLVALGLVALHLVGLRVDKLVPFPTWDATVPAGYRCLASGPAGAIIELPYSWTQAHLYYQTAHGRPIFGGMIENNPVFAPEAAVTLREDNTFAAALMALSRLDRVEHDPVLPEDRQAVRDLGYAYVVLQRDAFVVTGDARSLMDNAARTRGRSMERSLSQLLGAPVWEDARIVIWSPWGDPAPCGEEVERETVAVGRPDEDPAAMVQGTPEDQRIHRAMADSGGQPP